MYTRKAIARISKRISDQGGMTLPELMIGAVMLVMILSVTYALLQVGQKNWGMTSQKINSRDEAARATEIISNQLRAAMLHLTEEQQQVIVLKFVEDLPNAHVAEIMGKTEGAIKALQHRGLAALRRVMDDGEFEKGLED